jgi:hypothetical protein
MAAQAEREEAVAEVEEVIVESSALREHGARPLSPAFVFFAPVMERNATWRVPPSHNPHMVSRSGAIWRSSSHHEAVEDRATRSAMFQSNEPRPANHAKLLLAALGGMTAEAKKGACNVLCSASHPVASWLLSLLCGCRRVHGYRWVA